MAQKKPTRRAKTARTSGTSTTQLVRQLERLDRQLVKQINERAKLSQQLIKARANDEDGPFDTAAEHALIDQAIQKSRGPLEAHSVRSIFREIVSGSRHLVKPLRVSYLGPKYSYSYLAAVERFGQSVELAPVATIAAVFEELNRGHSNFGVVPLENSTDGRVADTLDMFARLPAKICGEVQLRIHHNLLARCPRDEIQEIYSKPQALSQCRDWIARHIPWARSVEMTSTAAAAQLSASKQGAAAIASLLAATNYGLDVVAANIEDNKHNVTRFAVIGGEAARRTGRDKTAMMFEISHRSGALADVMSIFKRGRLNLTWIESFPLSGSENEYLFFVELEGHESDAKVRKALQSLARKTVRLDLLGSYAKCAALE